MVSNARRAIHPAVLLAAAAHFACGPGALNLPEEESVEMPRQGTVVVYVEAPRRLAGPVLKTFEEQTGIEVNATYRENLGDQFLSTLKSQAERGAVDIFWGETPLSAYDIVDAGLAAPFRRSEEHTSELQSLTNLVCRLLLEKKNNNAKY